LWDAVIYGPDNSDWEGATLLSEIHFPAEYPDKPPRVYIKTRHMFHPNVSSSDGYFCLKMFYSEHWRREYNVITVMATIQAVLVCPNPDSPNNSNAASLWRKDRSAYARQVRAAVRSSWRDF
jgi:ubiquitin-conjugating enzyme E2 A